VKNYEANEQSLVPIFKFRWPTFAVSNIEY
jgi:hypothetical protein